MMCVKVMPAPGSAYAGVSGEVAARLGVELTPKGLARGGVR